LELSDNLPIFALKTNEYEEILPYPLVGCELLLHCHDHFVMLYCPQAYRAAAKTSKRLSHYAKITRLGE
jgi:hypothetical protein